LRDYVRIFNGLLWYGDVLIENDHTARRYLIEQFFERIDQWSFLIPTQYWLSLRPARFLEIFLRAEIWANFKTKPLIDRLFESSPDEIKASWHYVLADSYAKVERLEDALEHLEIILDDSVAYMAHADDELRILSRNLYNIIHLEALGILVGNFDQQSPWMELPLSIQLDEVSNYLEPESYLKEETRPPLLRMMFQQPPFEQQIAIFGDKLFAAFEIICVRKLNHE